MRGIDVYRTKDSFAVARVHYTSDPDKCTPEAIAELERGYPGGRLGAAWRKEMEIDFTAYSGQLLCYHILQQYRNKIIVDKFIPSFHLKFGSLDWGRNNPASFHIYSVDENKNVHSTSEVYVNQTSIPEFARMMKEAKHYSEISGAIIADPSLFNNNQEEQDGVESIADKFAREGIDLMPAPSRNDEIAINELLDRWNRLDEKEPTFTISPRCPKQIWEFERLRYRELTTAMLDVKNVHEVLVDKDNHSWDDFKYFISNFLKPADPKQPERINPNSAYGRYLIKQRQQKEGIYAR